MKPRLFMTQEAGDAPGAGEHPCPRCAGNLIRIRRRVIDRLLSLFVPVHRYECSHSCCGWEGNLRVRSGAAEKLRVRSGGKGMAS
jgi:hypothetical protein